LTDFCIINEEATQVNFD